MKNHTINYIILFICLLSAFFGCAGEEDAEKKIKQLEIKLYSDKETLFDRNTADQLINSYAEFVAEYPKNEKAAGYLFKAAEVCMSINASKKAIELYARVHEEYSGYSKAPASLFLQAFVYETQLKNNAMAQKFYLEFLSKYPGDKLADDAKFSLENLGKTDEEIIREFEEKRAEGENKDSL